MRPPGPILAGRLPVSRCKQPRIWPSFCRRLLRMLSTTYCSFGDSSCMPSKFSTSNIFITRRKSC